MNKQSAVTATSEARTGAKTIGGSLQALFNQGADTIDTIRSRVSEITGGASTNGSQLLERTAKLVEQRPLTAVAVAFGIGHVARRITSSKLTPMAIVGALLYLAIGPRT
jgi:ElaB/YqjD/DUF883 family membrane-anchored ribosome-binding protein